MNDARNRRRVVIVDDSRTIQALLETAFSDRPEFKVVGVAGDAQSGAEMITRLGPDIATIDLCMPYIDGPGLLTMIRTATSTCAITVSDHSAKNVAMAAHLKSLGAAACLTKSELANDPGAFFQKVTAAHDAFRISRLRDAAVPISKRDVQDQPPRHSRLSFAHFGHPIPTDEKNRLEALARLGLATATHERRFDLVTKHLADSTGYPVCLLTFIDEERQWIKSVVGLEVESTPRSQAFCNYTISQDCAFVVPDATTDKRFATNPLVAGPPYIRSYAGTPIIARDGTRLGALCLIDVKPRTATPGTLRQLAGMAEIVSEMIEPRPVPDQALALGVPSGSCATASL